MGPLKIGGPMLQPRRPIVVNPALREWQSEVTIAAVLLTSDIMCCMCDVRV